jgi:hypothetical protein
VFKLLNFITDSKGALLLMLLSAFCSAVLNLFSKNMSMAVENFQVTQCLATIMHGEILLILDQL